MSSELKACPRCAGEGLIVHQRWSGRDYYGSKCGNICECGLFLDTRADTPELAATAWNTRTNPDGLREALEEARDFLRSLAETDTIVLASTIEAEVAKLDAALASLPHGGEATSPAA